MWLRKIVRVRWQIFSQLSLLYQQECGPSPNPQMMSSKVLKGLLTCRVTHLGRSIAYKWKYEAKIGILTGSVSALRRERSRVKTTHIRNVKLHWVEGSSSKQKGPSLTQILPVPLNPQPSQRHSGKTSGSPSQSLKYLPYLEVTVRQAGTLLQE